MSAILGTRLSFGSATTRSRSSITFASDWHDNPELCKMRSDRIDHRGLLADEQMARAVQRQAALLLRCLGRNERMFGLVTASQMAARACLAALGTQLRMLKAQILEFDRMINAWHRSNKTSKKLDEIPGVGPALATALVAGVADPKAFRSGRDFSAWIGLVPKQHSSGGKEKLGSISKRGDRHLRGLFTSGALAVIRYAKIHGPSTDLG